MEDLLSSPLLQASICSCTVSPINLVFTAFDEGPGSGSKRRLFIIFQAAITSIIVH